MEPRTLVFVLALAGLGAAAAPAAAQVLGPMPETVPEARTERTRSTPPALRLPTGVKVRAWTRGLSGRSSELRERRGESSERAVDLVTPDLAWSPGRPVRIDGYLRSCEGGVLTIVPETGNLMNAAAIELPVADVERLELGLARKRHWVKGLLIGAVFGLLVGLDDEVDPVLCKESDYIACTRPEAIAVDTLALAAVGLGVGGLVKTQRWTPVALDALEPLHPPRRGAGLQLTIRF